MGFSKLMSGSGFNWRFQTEPEPSVSLLSPLLSVLPGQLFAAGLARAKGFDPDSPRGLTKVTLAR